MLSRIARFVVIGFLAAGAAPASDPAAQPVYFYLFGRFSDFVNMELTERRIRETLRLIDEYRQKHFDQHVSATILVSGALSQAISEANSKTGLLDFMLDHARRGVIQFGYDGTDEPTYHRRARPNFSAGESAQERWLARVAAMDRFLTESRDIFGVEQKGKPGGLDAMQQVFGEAVCVTGLSQEIGVDSDFVHALSRHNSKAIMWGIPDPDPARNLHGYRGSAESFGNYLSPTAGFSPDLNWVDNRLRSSETSDASIRLVSLAEGVDGIKGVVGKIARKHIRIVHVEIGDVRIYLSDFYRSGALYPPLRFAYDHPDRPKLPVEAFADQKELATSLRSQQAGIDWLTEQFLPANEQSRFVSSTDLRDITQPVIGEAVRLEDMERAAPDFLKTWSTETYLPNHLEIGNRYLSVADCFYVLANILGQQVRTGERPVSVTVAPLFGPLETTDDHGPALGSVTAASVNRAARTLADTFGDRVWKPMPANMIPAWLEVDGIRINGAQFLKLMFESLVAASPETKIKVQMTNPFSAAGLVYPRMRLPEDQGGTWTLRPARLDASRMAMKAQR